MVKFSHICSLPLFIQPCKNKWHMKVLIWIKPICKQGTGTNSLNMNWLQQVTVSALFIAICHLFGAIDTHPKSPEVTGFVALTFSPNTAYFSLETFVSPTTGDQRVWSLSRLIFLQNPQPEPESPVQRVGGGRDGRGKRQQQRDHHRGAAGQRYSDSCSEPARALRC